MMAKWYNRPAFDEETGSDDAGSEKSREHFSLSQESSSPRSPREVHFAFVNFGTREESRIILVRDGDKSRPPYWKLVGGRGDEHDIPGIVCRDGVLSEKKWLAEIVRADATNRIAWAESLLPRLTTPGERTVVREVFEEVRLRVVPERIIFETTFDRPTRGGSVCVRWVAWEVGFIDPTTPEDIVLGEEIESVGIYSPYEIDLLIKDQQVLGSPWGVDSHREVIDRYLHGDPSDGFLGLPRTI